MSKQSKPKLKFRWEPNQGPHGRWVEDKPYRNSIRRRCQACRSVNSGPWFFPGEFCYIPARWVRGWGAVEHTMSPVCRGCTQARIDLVRAAIASGKPAWLDTWNQDWSKAAKFFKLDTTGLHANLRAAMRAGAAKKADLMAGGVLWGETGEAEPVEPDVWTRPDEDTVVSRLF